MAFHNAITFAVDYQPTGLDSLLKYRYPTDAQFVGGSTGTQKSSVSVDNGGDASTDSNGTGYKVGGSPYVNSRTGGSLLVDRYGQKDGRVLVRVGHDTNSNGSATNFQDSIKGMHLQGVIGCAFKYNVAEADSGYSAMMNRIMVQYSWKQDSSSYYYRKVFDCTAKGTGSESLRVHQGSGDKFYCYLLPVSERDLVMDNKLTCEGFFFEFKANKSPGCCKNKHVAAQIWGLTPIILSKKGGYLSTAANFVHVPVAYDTTVKDARYPTGLMKLATN